jgi:aspartyl/asparaginyl-tRNA synthetase
MWIELVTTKNEKKIMSEITEALGGDARVVKAKFLMKQIKHNRITTIQRSRIKWYISITNKGYISAADELAPVYSVCYRCVGTYN